MNATKRRKKRTGRMTFSIGRVRLGGRMFRCRIYSWEAPDLVGGPVRFIGPDGGNPCEQRFIPEPLAKFLAAQNPRNKPDAKTRADRQKAKKEVAAAQRALDEFFDAAFDTGYEALKRLDPGNLVVGPSHFAVMKALFRNRGHLANRRRLDSGAELVRPTFDMVLDVVLPGLGNCELREYSGHSHQRQRSACVRDALTAAGWPCAPTERVAPAARAFSQERASRKVAARKPEDAVRLENITRLPWRSVFDALTTGGLARWVPWDGATASSAVADGLLAGEESMQDNIAQCRADPRFMNRLLERLMHAVRTKRPREFEKWFRAEREHGFMWLLGSTCNDVPRDLARAAMRVAYRVLTWLSVQYLAKCYGAWAGRAWIDFYFHNTEGRPAADAVWLFKQQNSPQLALAGLPMAFLTPGQLLWAAGPLLRSWGEAAWNVYHAPNHHPGGGTRTDQPERPYPTDLFVPDGSADDVATAILGDYAETAGAVRKADRESRAAARRAKAAKTRRDKQSDRRRDREVTEVGEAEGLQRGRKRAEVRTKVPSVPRVRNAPRNVPVLRSASCEKCRTNYVPRAYDLGPNGERYAELKCECGFNWFAVGDDFGK